MINLDQEKASSIIYAESDDFENLFIRIAKFNKKEDFKHADLEGVNFGNADLSGYDFSHANLRGANLSRVQNINFAQFSHNTVLENARLPNNENWTDFLAKYDIQTVLIKAVMDGDHEKIINLPGDVKELINNLIISNKSLLTFAVQKRNYKVVDALLQLGANADGVAEEFTTPLNAAGWNGEISILLLLIKHGANVDRLDSIGDSVLHDVVNSRALSVWSKNSMVRRLHRLGISSQNFELNADHPIMWSIYSKKISLFKVLARASFIKSLIPSDREKLVQLCVSSGFLRGAQYIKFLEKLQMSHQDYLNSPEEA